MASRPRAVLLKFPGTNCDRETKRALTTVGFDAEIVPFARFDRETVFESDLIVFSGGFSYGDYVKAGRLAKLELRQKVGSTLDEFAENGGFLLGICNGFQILHELDLLPTGSLIQNESGRFICKWTTLRVEADNEYYLSELPNEFELPIAHMEGRFVSLEGNAKEYRERGLVPLVYEENPNGSQEQIAGLQDSTGRIFGLMPHPERFLFARDHYDPHWNEHSRYGWGYFFFDSLRNAIETHDPSHTGTKTTIPQGN